MDDGMDDDTILDCRYYEEESHNKKQELSDEEIAAIGSLGEIYF